MLVMKLSQNLLKQKLILSRIELGIELNKSKRTLVLMMPIMIGCVTSFKFEDKNSKYMSFHIGDDKLLGICKAIWTNIEDLNNFLFNTLPVCGKRYIKTESRKFGDKVPNNLRGINVLENDIERESFTLFSIYF